MSEWRQGWYSEAQYWTTSDRRLKIAISQQRQKKQTDEDPEE